VRSLGIVALLVAGGVFLCAEWRRAPGANRSPSARRPARLAGPGFIPTGAPLRPPPLPPPRRGARAVPFDLLAGFDFDPEVGILPDDIEALDGALVEIAGVMYYDVADPERVERFYLMPNHYVCCYGTPRANDVVEVQLRDGAHTVYLLNYFLVRGHLQVGAVRNDAGQLLCLFRIGDAEAEVLE